MVDVLLLLLFLLFRLVHITLAQARKKLRLYGKGSMSWNEGARRQRDGENVRFGFCFLSGLGSSLRSKIT